MVFRIKTYTLTLTPTNQHMKNKYPISSYNKYICLKMNATMWFILLFILKPYLIIIMSIANFRKPMNLIEMVYPERLTMALTALAAIPVGFLLYAWSRREPDASDTVKNIWHKGFLLLTVTTVLNAVFIFIPFLLERTSKIFIIDWVQFAACLLILITLYRNSYIKDCFADFPENKG